MAKLSATQIRAVRDIAAGKQYYISGPTANALVKAGVAVYTDTGAGSTLSEDGKTVISDQPWSIALTIGAKILLAIGTIGALALVYKWWNNKQTTMTAGHSWPHKAH